MTKGNKSEGKNLDELRNEIDATAAELAEAGQDLDNSSIDLEELKELAEGNPVKKLINLVLLQSIREGASDIYFENFEYEVKMRYRVDGIIYEMIPPPRHIAEAMGNELERMAGKLEEESLTKKQIKKGIQPKTTKLLQYGEKAQAEITAEGKPCILMLSKIKSKFRDSYRAKLFYPEYCTFVFNETQKMTIEGQLLEDGGGLVIIAALPGNGKTTTAHALLGMKNSPYKLLLAIGGEKTVDGINHIDTDLKYTNPDDLSKTIEHFDPNILYLDNINKKEIAEIAINQTYRNKTVIGSLEAPSILAGLDYLVKKGVEKSELADVFRGGIEQRLVGKPHEKCKGKGCDGCNMLGYHGREAEMKFFWDNDESAKELREYLKAGKNEND